MLVAYRLSDTGPEIVPIEADGRVPADASWVDVFQPTAEEDRATEAFLGASLPTREETQEIEFSSRFYTEDGATYMTAPLLTGIDIGKPVLTPFTIVVARDRIATLRYEDLRAFRQFLARAIKPGSGCISAPGVFVGLIEAVVDRTADVLERISADIDRINSEVFGVGRADARQRGRRLELMMGDIGVQGDLAAKARESLASLERLVQFATLALPSSFAKGSSKQRLKLAGRDIRSLEDQVTFLSNKINFLLDATLGLISVQQNEVIRILTVATGIFFPPTLIATIYGMNFDFMPELHWGIGYPLALVVMIASAVLPYIYFRRRGWL
ncbi:MAG TPA: magnesium transporter CorA family protein [Bauldia sp.]|nr:magnesium transporter CorA family protein [Bauldia sp.]